MLQTLLTLSPVIVLFIISFLGFIVAQRTYQSRKEKLGVDMDERTLGLIWGGSLGIAICGSALLVGFTQSRTMLLMPLLCGILFLVVGEWTLRTSVIAGKTYFFALSMTITGMALAFFNFVLLTNMREPFIFICSAAVSLSCFMHIFLFDSWKHKRKPKL